jgi:uncharacterized C2H2 Zn-finger protein
MVSSFHHSPSYSAYRTQNATGVESGQGQWLTGLGGHDQESWPWPIPAQAAQESWSWPSPAQESWPWPPSPAQESWSWPSPAQESWPWPPSPAQADDVDASQVFAMPVLCKIGLNVSAQTVLACPVCHAVYRRPQDRKRHMLIHLPCWLQCPEGGCPWRGDRWENLQRHRNKNHSYSSQKVDRIESMIYDPWPLVEGIKDESTLQNATQQAISSVKKRAVEVGKLELWEGDFWKRRKAREVHGPGDDDKDSVPKAGHDDGYMSGVNQ